MKEHFDKTIAEFDEKIKNTEAGLQGCLKQKRDFLALVGNCETALTQVQVALGAARELNCVPEFEQAVLKLFEPCREYPNGYIPATVPKDIQKTLLRSLVVVDSSILNENHSKVWTLRYSPTAVLMRNLSIGSVVRLEDKHKAAGWDITPHYNGNCWLRWDGETWKDFDREWSGTEPQNAGVPTIVPRDITAKLLLGATVIDSNLTDTANLKVWTLKYSKYAVLTGTPDATLIRLDSEQHARGWNIVLEGDNCLLQWQGEKWEDCDREPEDFMPGSAMC